MTSTKLELVKKRSEYAVATFTDTWTMSIRKFFPLFLGWFVSLGLPVCILVVTVIGGMVFDWKMWGMMHGGYGTLAALFFSLCTIGGFWAGWNFIALKVARGIDVKATDLFRPLPQVLSAIAVLAITSVLIWLGSLLILPGALLFLRWQLAPFYIVDRNCGPIEALKRSWHDTEMVFVPLALLDLMLFGVTLITGTIGALVVIGPIMAHITFTIASALVYAKWLTDDNHPDIPKIEHE